MLDIYYKFIQLKHKDITTLMCFKTKKTFNVRPFITFIRNYSLFISIFKNPFISVISGHFTFAVI